MLPGISAEDCLFADLGVDPGRLGCQSFEATDFLLYRRKFDNTSALILWQIGVIGVMDHKLPETTKGLEILTNTLEQFYGRNHMVVNYEAAQYPVCDPVIHPIQLVELPSGPITAISTLFVPPKEMAHPDLDIMQSLGIPISYGIHRDEYPYVFDPLRPNFLTRRVEDPGESCALSLPDTT